MNKENIQLQIEVEKLKLKIYSELLSLLFKK